MPEEKQDALAISSPVAVQVKAGDPQSNKLTRLAAFTPTNLTEAVALAKLIASSDLAPKDYRGKAGNVLIAMQLGAELGVAPMSAIQNIAVINGRPSVWGDMMLALVQAHPDYEDHKEFMTGTGEGRTAVFQIKRKGQGWHEQKFSVADAKTAQLWNKVGPWKTNPDRMLQMRARGFGLRDKFADAIKGLRLAEESMDLPPDTNKPTRETGKLELNGITSSPEPNRGHGNEGMVQGPTLSNAPGMDQTEKKVDDTMCGDCRLMNGKHAPDCIHAVPPGGKCPDCNATGGHLPKCPRREATASPTAQPASQESESTTQSVEEPQKAANRIPVKITKVTKRTVAPLRRVEVLTNDGTVEMSVWHKSLHPIVDGLVDQYVIVEYSEKEKDGKVWTNLEKLFQQDGKPFVEEEF